MNLTSTFEGVGIAIDALRSNKVRAALTILGIVIGVTVVITMAAAIGGFRSTILEQVESLGPKNFIVNRFEQTAIRVDDGTDKPPWAGKPPLTFAEAEMISHLPAVHAVAPAIDTQADVKAGNKSSGGGGAGPTTSTASSCVATTTCRTTTRAGRPWRCSRTTWPRSSSASATRWGGRCGSRTCR